MSLKEKLVRINQDKILSVNNADYTITNSDNVGVLLVTTGASNRTVTLPIAANNINRKITIKKVDTGVGYVTVDGNGAETIDGLTTISFNGPGDFVEIVCNGTAWFVIAGSAHEYVSNSSTTNTNDTTSFAYGHTGSGFMTSNPDAAISKRVRFLTAFQRNDFIVPEVFFPGATAWQQVNGLLISGNDDFIGIFRRADNGDFDTGFGTWDYVNTTDIDVRFGRRGAYFNSGMREHWADLNAHGLRWRMKKKIY